MASTVGSGGKISVGARVEKSVGGMAAMVVEQKKLEEVDSYTKDDHRDEKKTIVHHFSHDVKQILQAC